jgi:fructokinase
MIVVAGESLIDLVARDPEHLRAHCGGGPFNTARVLARLGQPVSFLGAISEDAFGARLRAALLDDGVEVDAVLATTRPTTLALAALDERAAARYQFYTEGTAAPGLTAAQALAALPAGFDTLHVGSLGLVLQPIAGAVTAVVEAAAAGEALVLLDPNIRAPVIVKRPEYLERFGHVLERTAVLKASAEDLAWLMPGRPALAAARELLTGGPELVLVTSGADDAAVVSSRGELAVAVPRVRVVDTIGAGDAFSAGFLAWWRHHGLGRDQLSDLDAAEAATRFACLVASRTCEHAGAAPVCLPPLP